MGKTENGKFCVTVICAGGTNKEFKFILDRHIAERVWFDPELRPIHREFNNKERNCGKAAKKLWKQLDPTGYDIMKKKWMMYTSTQSARMTDAQEQETLLRNLNG